MTDFINLQYTTTTRLLPGFIYKGLKDYSKHANGYRFQPEIIVERLAKKHSVPKEMIYLTAGADEAIQMFALAFGNKAYIFPPTYVVYSDMTDFYANVIKEPSRKENEYAISTDQQPDATLIYLANPNNPFGFTPKEKVIELIENNKQAIVVIDEVYAKFADLSVLHYVSKYPHLAVLRSFSKEYGMAGNRIGYIITQPEIIDKVKVKTQSANVSYLAVGAAMAALDHEDYFENFINEIKKQRDEFIEFLKRKNFTILPSLINAVLIKFSTEIEGTKFVEYLTMNKFIISHGNGNSNIGLDKSYVRISIGNKNEMDMLMKIIEKYE